MPPRCESTGASALTSPPEPGLRLHSSLFFSRTMGRRFETTRRRRGSGLKAGAFQCKPRASDATIPPNPEARMRKALFAVLLAVPLAGCHANPRFVCAPPQPASCPLPLCKPGAAPPRDIRNLVVEGGGVKGLAYPGALEVLEGNDVLPKIDRVAGTS